MDKFHNLRVTHHRKNPLESKCFRFRHSKALSMFIYRANNSKESSQLLSITKGLPMTILPMLVTVKGFRSVQLT
jgi:hypothetical protein